MSRVRKRLASRKDFSVSAVMHTLGKKKVVTDASLKNFFTKNGFYCNKDDRNDILKFLDLVGDGEVSIDKISFLFSAHSLPKIQKEN